MSRIPQSHFVQGGVYHIYNRGNRKQDIFLSPKDYKRYLKKLTEYKNKHNIAILSYCLMPNHVHLLVKQNSPDPVSKFLQRLHTSYSMYFNRKHKTVGHVFQDRFKAITVNKTDHIIHLSRYIHLNPSTLVQKLPSYIWSSYPTFLGVSNDGLTDTKFVLSHFKRKNDSQKDVINSYKYFVKKEKQDLEKIRNLIFEEEPFLKPLDKALEKIQGHPKNSHDKATL